MSYIQQQEEANHIVATDSDWDRADARQSGQEHPERAWVLTDRDVWHANPFYKGPAVPHPEDDVDYDDKETATADPYDEFAHLHGDFEQQVGHTLSKEQVIRRGKRAAARRAKAPKTDKNSPDYRSWGYEDDVPF